MSTLLTAIYGLFAFISFIAIVVLVNRLNERLFRKRGTTTLLVFFFSVFVNVLSFSVLGIILTYLWPFFVVQDYIGIVFLGPYYFGSIVCGSLMNTWNYWSNHY